MGRTEAKSYTGDATPQQRAKTIEQVRIVVGDENWNWKR